MNKWHIEKIKGLIRILDLLAFSSEKEHLVVAIMKVRLELREILDRLALEERKREEEEEVRIQFGKASLARAKPRRQTNSIQHKL